MDCIIKHLDVVEGGGGHKGACGVSIRYDRIDDFKSVCNYEFSKWLQDNPDGLTPTLNATCEIDFSNINIILLNNIDRLKPFGNGNPEPKFISNDVNVVNAKVVGKNKNVIQLTLRQGFFEFKAVGFEAFKNKYIEAGNPSEIKILYNIGLNEWPKGEFKIQLMLSDFK